jgi:DNA-directed RNA polymerase specialized sigma24 family protein
MVAEEHGPGIDPELVRLVERIVRRRVPASLREDVMQAGLLWLLENQVRLRTPDVGCLPAYVATSIRRLASKLSEVEERGLMSVGFDIEELPAPPERDPTGTLEIDLLESEIKCRLPAREAGVWEQIVIRKSSVREAARELGIAPGQVRRSRKLILGLLVRIAEDLQVSG